MENDIGKITLQFALAIKESCRVSQLAESILPILSMATTNVFESEIVEFGHESAHRLNAGA